MIANLFKQMLCMALLISVIPGVSKATETLYLAMSDDWMPYVYLDRSGKATGEDYTLLERTLAHMDYEILAVDLPEQRMRLDISKGHVDVTLGAVSTVERREQNYFSIPYRLETIVLAYRRSAYPDWTDVELERVLQKGDLVAVNNSGWFGEWFRYHIQETYPSQLVHAEGTLRRMQLLKLGRVSAVIGDINVLKEAGQQLAITDLEVSKAVINQTPVHFMFSRLRVDSDFMKRFNQALKHQLDDSVKLP